MSPKALPKLSLLLCLILLPIAMQQLGGSEAGKISVYWGQNVREGNLSSACESGNYDIVNIAYLSTFGNGTKMTLNLTDHCSQADNSCAALSTQIKQCQRLGVKVFLSIGGDYGNYALASPEDARKVANDIWNNFLGGCQIWWQRRPLGNVGLDGIDFDIQKGGDLYYAELATTLRRLSGGKKLYLSAALGCSELDYEYHYHTLRFVAFDYVSIRFYNDDSCEYTGSVFRLMSIWGHWNSEVKAGALFLGLPPSPEAAESGYVSANTLVYEILPQLEKSSKFGGLMLSSRYYDLVRGYSSTIKPFIHDAAESF